ncbi:hypothetical protein [Mycobacterium paraffinicum]|nr:hypothetical protein [Mycobacterium paraffinicum]
MGQPVEQTIASARHNRTLTVTTSSSMVMTLTPPRKLSSREPALLAS